MLTTQPLGVLGTRTEKLEGAGIRERGKYLGRQAWLFNLITHKNPIEGGDTDPHLEGACGWSRVETSIQTLEFPAPGEIYQRQGEEGWEKEIRLAETSSPQLTRIQVWGIGWDTPRCLPATQNPANSAPRNLALLAEGDQGDGWPAGVSPVPRLESPDQPFGSAMNDPIQLNDPIQPHLIPPGELGPHYHSLVWGAAHRWGQVKAGTCGGKSLMGIGKTTEKE